MTPRGTAPGVRQSECRCPSRVIRCAHFGEQAVQLAPHFDVPTILMVHGPGVPDESFSWYSCGADIVECGVFRNRPDAARSDFDRRCAAMLGREAAS